ncbi:MAG: hypothetical protein P4K83_01670 [Terracidiphilus sp.]|nr:hypothetical protein [Terracidiphilus sp.]
MNRSEIFFVLGAIGGMRYFSLQDFHVLEFFLYEIGIAENAEMEGGMMWPDGKRKVKGCLTRRSAYSVVPDGIV